MTLIDTSAWIEFFRSSGQSEVKSRVAAYVDAGEAAYCGPIEFELMTGTRNSEVEPIRTALGYSILLDFPLACWRQAAQLESGLREVGVTVPRDDIFVAAAALHHRTPVYASDAHFPLMRDRGHLSLQLA